MIRRKSLSYKLQPIRNCRSLDGYQEYIDVKSTIMMASGISAGGFLMLCLISCCLCRRREKELAVTLAAYRSLNASERDVEASSGVVETKGVPRSLPSRGRWLPEVYEIGDSQRDAFAVSACCAGLASIVSVICLSIAAALPPCHPVGEPPSY